MATVSSQAEAPPPLARKARRSHPGSAIGLTLEGDRAIIADEDHESLFIVRTTFDDLSSARVVPMPGPPAQVVVLDGIVLVTVRTLPTEASRAARAAIIGPPPQPDAMKVFVPVLDQDPPRSSAPRGEKQMPSLDAAIVRQSEGGLLVAMKPDSDRGLVEVGRVTLAPDAWGLAVTSDGSRAVVTSAWASEVSVVDISDPAAMKVVARLPSPREPRGVVITADDRTAFISHLTSSALSRVDDLEGAPALHPQPLRTAPARGPAGRETAGSLGYSLALSPDGATLFAPRHAIGAEGNGSWWGAPTIDVLDVRSGTSPQPVRVAGSPAMEAEFFASMTQMQWPAKPGRAPTPPEALSQPRAIVYRKTSDSLWIASEGADAIVEVSAIAPEPSLAILRTVNLSGRPDVMGLFPLQGAAPSALALTPDDSSLMVYCRTTFDLVRFDIDTGKRKYLRLANDTLPTAASRGRRVFAEARSGVSAGLACASCHPEGRDDGYVWREAVGADRLDTFVGLREDLTLSQGTDASTIHVYPRQTPMLAGRVRASGPYGWHGKSENILKRILEGNDLHGSAGSFDEGRNVTMVDYVVEYARGALVPPPTLVRPLGESEARGKALFESAKTQCATCHAPEREMTDRSVVQLAPRPVQPSFDAEEDKHWKTPSLWFLGGTAPYFHDGSAATLEDLVETNGRRMGDTSGLSADDKADLVAYLKTL